MAQRDYVIPIQLRAVGLLSRLKIPTWEMLGA